MVGHPTLAHSVGENEDRLVLRAVAGPVSFPYQSASCYLQAIEQWKETHLKLVIKRVYVCSGLVCKTAVPIKDLSRQ